MTEETFTPKSDYIPTTDEIETGFSEFASWLETDSPGEFAEAPEFSDWREAMWGFRRWLAERDRQIAERAWDEALDQSVDTWWNGDGLLAPNPYRTEK